MNQTLLRPPIRAGIRGQKSEASSQEPELRIQNSELRIQDSELPPALAELGFELIEILHTLCAINHRQSLEIGLMEMRMARLEGKRP